MDKQEVLQELAKKEVEKYGEELSVEFPIKELHELGGKEKTQWIWEGYLAKGHKTLLSAYWKAGKTTLIFHFLRALKEERPFLGLKTFKVKTLIITEETENIWGEKRDQYEVYTDDEIYFGVKPLNHKLNHKEWLKFIAFIHKSCVEKKIELVVFDTLTEFWPVEDENNASAVAKALTPYNLLLKENICVLNVHHLNKAGGDDNISSRGSGQLTAAHDVLMTFKQLQGHNKKESSDDEINPNDTRRKLTAKSRFSETPIGMVIQLNEDEEYVKLGLPQEVGKNADKEKLLSLIPYYPEFWSRAVIEERWKQVYKGFPIPSKWSLNRSLIELVNLEAIMLDPDGLENGRPIERKTQKYAKIKPDSTAGAGGFTPPVRFAPETNLSNNAGATGATSQNTDITDSKLVQDTSNIIQPPYSDATPGKTLVQSRPNSPDNTVAPDGITPGNGVLDNNKVETVAPVYVSPDDLENKFREKEVEEFAKRKELK
jgi:hypothetical protein